MQVDILEYLELVKKYRKLLICNLTVVLLISIILSLVWPKQYKAVTRFAPAFYVQTPFSELRAAGTPDLYSLIIGGVLISDVYVGIMKSRTVMENVVNRTGLMDVFRRRLMDDAIVDLERNSLIEIGAEEIITLTIFMPSPELAAQVANEWVKSLDSLNQWATRIQGSRESIFISSRLADIKQEIDSLRDSLTSFESKYVFFSGDEELKVAVDVYADLVRQLHQKEVELSKWSSFDENAPIRRSIEADIENLRKKMAELEVGRRAGIVAKVPLAQLPLLQFEHSNLLRAEKTLDSLTSYLLLEYEIARLKSLVNTPTVIVIDQAAPPERRIWPARAKIVLFSLFFGLCFNLILVLALENIKVKWKL